LTENFYRLVPGDAINHHFVIQLHRQDPFGLGSLFPLAFVGNDVAFAGGQVAGLPHGGEAAARGMAGPVPQIEMNIVAVLPIHSKVNVQSLGPGHLLFDAVDPPVHLAVIDAQGGDHGRREAGHGGGPEAVLPGEQLHGSGGGQLGGRQDDLDLGQHIFDGHAVIRDSQLDSGQVLQIRFHENAPGGQVRVVGVHVGVGQKAHAVQAQLPFDRIQFPAPFLGQAATGAPQVGVGQRVVRDIHHKKKMAILRSRRKYGLNEGFQLLGVDRVGHDCLRTCC